VLRAVLARAEGEPFHTESYPRAFAPQTNPAPPTMDRSAMAMMSAAKDDDVARVSQFLASGVAPSAANGIGQTALHVAALWGSIKCAKVLIEADADMNAVNQFGATPLHFAAQNSRLEVGQLLVASGADPRVQAGNGMMPYEMAGTPELRAALGAPSNLLHRAVVELDLPKLKALIDDGGDLSEADTKGQTALHVAALAALNTDGADDPDQREYVRMRTDVLKLLAGAAKASGACDATDNEGMSALHLFVRHGHIAGAAVLLEAGADPNARSRASGEYRSGQWARQTADGKTETVEPDDRAALHMAIDPGEGGGEGEGEGEGEAPPPDSEMIALLLRHKADPNVRDTEKRTALHLALAMGGESDECHLELAELLLAHGADPALGNNEIGMSNTCLGAAAARNDATVVKMLLRHGVAHSAPAKGGFSPLALAARGGATKVIGPLLDAGADPDAPTPVGKSARELAVTNKKVKVIEAFDAHTAAAGATSAMEQ
tara:strand:+ start:296 stop:1768 length:1473 start_codon:yes stop_codon:yes gene_type:complete